MNAVSDNLLKSFRLRTTSSREEILLLFLKKEYALSQSDIEREIKNSSDRVTVYRTLKTFLDKGLIHKVLDNGGSLKYALCREACTLSSHRHDHVHFKCEECGQTNCLGIEIPPVKLPKGYKARELNVLVQGVCEQCAK
jgi:Fur family ferric uptake transcriptional regulator